MRRLGALPRRDGEWDFAVWAPEAAGVTVRVNGTEHALERDGDGTWSGDAPAGDYVYAVDGRELPDPCSRCQPEGVRGPSRTVDTGAFDVAPGPGLKLDQLVIYELHVGT